MGLSGSSPFGAAASGADVRLWWKRPLRLDRHPGLDPGSRFSSSAALLHRGGWIDIMADRYRSALYVGVTADLPARIRQYRRGDGSDFCRRDGLHRLISADHTPSITDAFAHERRLKRWWRAWKFALIERGSHAWRDPFDTLT